MSYTFPRCQVLPLPDDQVSLCVDGVERIRWHHGASYPRPFLYPLVGPSGVSLTRMGHPGASNHDHHRSVWFAHHKVLGIDFWGDNTKARIRQKHWLAYQDGDQEAAMAVALGWYDGHNPRELLEQRLVVGVRPADDDEALIELQSTFSPAADSLEFGKTNFGFLAVRVAGHLSAYFGGGQLTSSEGRRGEPQIFGKRARWMDYSGPAPNRGRVGPSDLMEGVTYIDHPQNPNYPSTWHVREDGWMGASVCFDGPVSTTKSDPLNLRYLLHAHRGELQKERADQIAEQFAASRPYEVAKAEVKHTQFVIRRAPGESE